ncbi:MAG TPA: hypothetical protein VFJ82_19340 [Longimicrobium sp.]|nr:hypothetical protein [Longimicrobium sp.]
MHLSLTRLDERRYETVITRGDGVRFRVTGVGHMFAIPHDLAHLAVEQALGLRRGFWGCVAAGAVFESMTWLSGRRRPHAEEHSWQVLRDNRAELGESEIVVRIVNDALQEGHGPGSAELRERLRSRWTQPGHPPRPITDAQVAAACAAWERMRELWNALPVGETLELDWADGPASPARHRRTESGDHPRLGSRPRRW